MSASWGESPWVIDARVPETRVPARCRVAVVGAGFTGLATAIYLARRGVDVAVFEADRVGAGSSGRTGGIPLDDTARGPLPGVDHCLESLRRLVRDCEIECGLALPGCWELTHEREGRPLWHDLDGELRIAGTVPGGTLDPGALLSGLVRAALAAGACVCERAPVGLAPGGPRRLRVGGEQIVEADWVVATLNAYGARALGLQSAVRTALTLATCTEPLARKTLRAIGLDPAMPFYTIDLPYLWGRVIPGDRLLIGGGLAFDPDDDVERIDIDSGEAKEAFARIERRTRGLHPALEAVSTERRWGGPVAFREERTPVLARWRDDDRLIVTGAYAGHGIALTLRIAELIADAILDDAALPPWGEL